MRSVSEVRNMVEFALSKCCHKRCFSTQMAEFLPFVTIWAGAKEFKTARTYYFYTHGLFFNATFIVGRNINTYFRFYHILFDTYPVQCTQTFSCKESLTSSWLRTRVLKLLVDLSTNLSEWFFRSPDTIDWYSAFKSTAIRSNVGRLAGSSSHDSLIIFCNIIGREPLTDGLNFLVTTSSLYCFLLRL